MPGHIQNENFLLPVTALAFCKLGRLYLLAGEGQYLNVFDYESRKLLRTERVFDLEAVHGIICRNVPRIDAGQALILIWGARSLTVFAIKSALDIDEHQHIGFSCIVPELRLDDWILDGCYQEHDSFAITPRFQRIKAILVTAHNVGYALDLDLDNNELGTSRTLYILSRAASGPRSILYSAHVTWPLDGCALVAAGTVFGEVILWSFDVKESEESNCTDSVCLHRTFIGHEGSVFGVRISDLGGDKERVLASCSDDRTIRIWDVGQISPASTINEAAKNNANDGEFAFLGGQNPVGSTGCLATVMGHGSRIWGLRFLNHNKDSWELMSHGEDGTLQIWTLDFKSEFSLSDLVRTHEEFKLSHQTTCSYHSGKNLWAVAVHWDPYVGYIFASGGADGKTAEYKPVLQASSRLSHVRSFQSSMQEASAIISETANNDQDDPANHPQMTTKKIYDDLQGCWKLNRIIDSNLTSFPSGKFYGTASFEQRHPSEEAFTAEYLYSESGDFVTNDGLRMKARRQYAYRYKEKTDVITVWFVKTDDGSTVDYYFHTLDFEGSQRNAQASGNLNNRKILTATGYHLCNEDKYTPLYTFPSGASKIDEWSATIKVLGPKKDYTAQATYTRDIPVDHPGVRTPTAHKNSTKIIKNGLADGSGRPTRGLASDAFKTYSWISGTQFLAATHAGNLLVGSRMFGQKPGHEAAIFWKLVGQQTLLRSSCIATSLPLSGIALLTGVDGTVFLYAHPLGKFHSIYKLSGKAAFLRVQALSSKINKMSLETSGGNYYRVIATCLRFSEATVFLIAPEEDSSMLGVRLSWKLKLPSSSIVTSACFADGENIILLGSRSGDIAIYFLLELSLCSADVAESRCVYKLHGHEAITVIENIPTRVQSENMTFILTAGRDGTYSIHKMSYIMDNPSSSQITFQTLHVGSPPFGPNIEGAHISTSGLYLWGFRSRDFVVWNETHKIETMTVNCGGAHRNWAYSHHRDRNGGGSFVYTKASVCHLHTQDRASHQVFQYGGHGREIKAMALSPPVHSGDGRRLHLLATGSEDTAIRLFDISNAHEEPGCLHILPEHTTGLQNLSFSPNAHYLFSAAGCEEFFVWRLRPTPLVTIGVVREAKCPIATEEKDLRIMDFALLPIITRLADETASLESEPDYLISTVYSDSSIRVFKYQPHTKTFALLSQGKYTTYCLTQIIYLQPEDGNTLHLCTGSTDGHLAFWTLPLPTSPHTPARSDNTDHVSINPTFTPSSQPLPLNPTTHTPTHQSSIKSLLSIPIPHHSATWPTLLITAGDDGAISLTLLTIPHAHSHPNHATTEGPPSQPPEVKSRLRIPKAHASAVTGLARLGAVDGDGGERDEGRSKHRFASVGCDQRVKMWIVTLDTVKGDIRVVKEANAPTSVADAAALEVERVLHGNGDGAGRGRKRLWVVGVGMESWSVDAGGTERRGV